ncbi:MAG: hypothetical protein WCF23_08980 [Candidatus Nitrosopolaris sp.]
MVAVDPKTFKVLSRVQMVQVIGGRVTATQYHVNDYAFVAKTTNLYRYERNGKNLILDKIWGPVPYVKPSQTLAGAVVLAGDWLILSTNSNPAKVLSLLSREDNRFSKPVLEYRLTKLVSFSPDERLL